MPHIHGLSINEKYAAIYNGKLIEIFQYDLNNGTQRILSTFEFNTNQIAIYENSLYVIYNNGIEILNLQGVMKPNPGLLFDHQIEGIPQHLWITNHYLAVITDLKILKVWNIQRAKPKAIVPARNISPNDNIGRILVSNKIGGIKHEENKRIEGLQEEEEDDDIDDNDDINLNNKNYIIKSIRVNSNGLFVSIIYDIINEQGIEVADSHIYIYDIEADKLHCYNFGPHSYPIQHYWDEKESKLLAIETQVYPHVIISNKKDQIIKNQIKDEYDSESASDDDDQNNDEQHNLKQQLIHDNEAEIYTLFVTSEDGILLHDSCDINVAEEALMGLNVPYIYIMKQKESSLVLNHNKKEEELNEQQQQSEQEGREIEKASSSSSSAVTNQQNQQVPAQDDSEQDEAELVKKIMRDFIGIIEEEQKKQNMIEPNLDPSIINDLLLFSYYLAIGNMDEAYRTVKRIKSDNVWENMAKMCVKNKRLDVAEICFSNISNANACKAIRLIKKTEANDINSQLALIAIQLKMYDQAELLYLESKRYDLLIKLYINTNKWHQAIKICHKYQRIKLKNTHYLYAKHLESLSLIKQAITHYELSETNGIEVPRMLYQLNQLDKLQQYIMNYQGSQKISSQLYSWLAKYYESIQQYNLAIEYYQKANDISSEIKLLLFIINIKKLV